MKNKIRIWNADQNKFLIDGAFSLEGEAYVLDMQTLEATWVLNGVVQNYIGFDDENGEEIYEGDILVDGISTTEDQYKEESGVVQYDLGEFIFLTNDLASVPVASMMEPVVIGNIFENPELK